MGDLIQVVKNYPLVKAVPEINQEDVDRLQQHYNHFLYQALLHRLVVGEYTRSIHVVYCYDFLLLPITPSVSCSCVDALNTPSSKLPLSPTVSRFLQPV